MRLRGRRRDPHDWASWTSYCDAHDGKLGDFDHFIVADRLERIIGTDSASWRGRLVALDGYELNVRRHQVVTLRLGVPWVRTAMYAYHACRRTDVDVVNLFRYDNIHEHPGHDTRHHRHRYLGGVEIKPPEHVGEAGWPNLGQVLDELHEYWVQKL